jgi:hypothetical protein
MSSRTYICPDCRWARRAEAAYWLNHNLRCPTCRGSLWELDKRWRIPRKSDAFGWKELAAKIARDADVIMAWRQRAGAAMLGKLDRQIAMAEKQRDSRKKVVRLRMLQKRRAETVYRYA